MVLVLDGDVISITRRLGYQDAAIAFPIVPGGYEVIVADRKGNDGPISMQSVKSTIEADSLAG